MVAAFCWWAPLTHQRSGRNKGKRLTCPHVVAVQESPVSFGVYKNLRSCDKEWCLVCWGRFLGSVFWVDGLLEGGVDPSKGGGGCNPPFGGGGDAIRRKSPNQLSPLFLVVFHFLHSLHFPWNPIGFHKIFTDFIKTNLLLVSLIPLCFPSVSLDLLDFP